MTRVRVVTATRALALVLFVAAPARRVLAQTASATTFRAMSGGDAQHTGRSSRRGPHTMPSIAWRVRTTRRVFASPVVNASGLTIAASLDGSVIALDPLGIVRWAYHAPGRVFATPALVDEWTVVGHDGGAYVALNSRGFVLWRHPTREDADASPVVGVDGTVYVAADAASALTRDGTVRWNTPLPSHVFGAPALTPDGRTMIVVELSGALDDLATDTGRLVRHTPLPAASRGGVLVLGDGAVVVGSDDGHLRCFNADRAPRWDVAVGSATTRVGIRGTPALGRDGTVIVGSEDGGIHGVRSSDGTTVFDVATGGPVRSPARIDADGWIFVGSEDDSVWALRPDGAVAWSFSLGNDVDGTPAIPVDGFLVVGCDDGGIYGLSAAPRP